MITKVLTWKGRLSRKSVLRLTILIWVYSIFWAILPLLGFGNYILEGTNTSCTFDFLTRTLDNRLYVVSIFTANFVIPLITILISYSLIYRAIIKHRNEFNFAARVSGESEHALPMQQNKIGVKHEVKIARISFIVISVFGVSWAPYAAIALIGVFGSPLQLTRLNTGISSLLAKISTVLNPLIYALLHSNFRNKLLNFRWCSKYNDKQRRCSVRRSASGAGIVSQNRDSAGPNAL